MIVVDEEELRRLPADDRALPGRAGPGSGRSGRHRPARPAGARACAWRTTTSDVPRPRHCSGSPPGRAGTSTPRTRRTPSAWPDCSGPGTLPTYLRLRDRAGRHPARPGSPRRRDAHVRAGAAACAEQGGPVLRGTADMYVGMSEVHRERDDLPGAAQHAAAEPGAGRAHRAAAEPVPVAGRDGPGPRGRRRPRRRARPARRGRARLRRRLLPQRAPDPGDAGAGLDRAGPACRRRRLGARAGPVRRGRPRRYLREFEHVTLARRAPRAPAASRSAEAIEPRWSVCSRRPKRAGRTGSVIEILVLQALASPARR